MDISVQEDHVDVEMDNLLREIDEVAELCLERALNKEERKVILDGKSLHKEMVKNRRPLIKGFSKRDSARLPNENYSLKLPTQFIVLKSVSSNHF